MYVCMHVCIFEYRQTSMTVHVCTRTELSFFSEILLFVDFLFQNLCIFKIVYFTKYGNLEYLALHIS